MGTQQQSAPTGRPLFAPAQGVQILLASASPRRRELLAAWGIPFTCLKAPENAEPRAQDGENPSAYAMRAARSKLENALSQLAPAQVAASLIIAADTVVCLNGRILGKPGNSSDALSMLERLSGHTHTVTSAVALHMPASCPAPAEEYLADTASVSFGIWSREVLAAYVASGEPNDKAGAYAIQGCGAFLVNHLSGSWSTVVGLPLQLLASRLLARGLISPA